MLLGSAKQASRLRSGMVLCALLVITSVVGAQDAQQRQAAADAYDRGSAAYLAEDYAAAARWFETANRLAPAAPALLQAIRAHRLAGNEMRSGTLALLMTTEYEGAAADEAQTIIDELAPQFFRVDVVCDGCAVTVDGSVAAHTSFYVAADETHQLQLGFATGDVEREVQGAAGESTSVEAEAPPRIETGNIRRDGAVGQGGGSTTQPVEEGGGISPALFVTSLVLTVGAGATLAWSGIDTANDADVYEETVRAGDIEAARVLLEEGQKEETRTNALIGVTAGLAAITVVLAIVTDWGGSSDDEDSAAAQILPSIGVAPGQGSVGLQGSF